MNGPISNSSSIVSSSKTNLHDKISLSSKMDSDCKMNTSSLCISNDLSLPIGPPKLLGHDGTNNTKYDILIKSSLQKILNVPPYLLFFILFINYTNPDIILVELIFLMGHVASRYPARIQRANLDSEATFSTRSFSVCSTYSSSTIHSLESAFHSCGSTSSMFSRKDSCCSSKADLSGASSSFFADDDASSSDFRSSFSNDLLTPASFIPVAEGSGDVDEWGHFTDFDESPSSFLPGFTTTTTTTNMATSSDLSDPFHSLEKSVLRRRGEKLSICRLDQLMEENECEMEDDW